MFVVGNQGALAGAEQQRRGAAVASAAARKGNTSSVSVGPQGQVMRLHCVTNADGACMAGDGECAGMMAIGAIGQLLEAVLHKASGQ